MGYWIMIFNTKSCRGIKIDRLVEVLKESNFNTLCEQYGLDPVMIEPALSNLKLIEAGNKIQPFFLLKYHRGEQRPIVVNYWEVRDEAWGSILQDAIDDAPSEKIKALLLQTHSVFGIELSQLQLKELGLLLGYELARWAAFKGEGIVQALDGQWYRLNRNKAFVPIND